MALVRCSGCGRGIVATLAALSFLPTLEAGAPTPPLSVNVERIAAMNVAGVRAAMVAAGWKTVKKVEGGIASEKPNGSKLFVDIWRGKPVRVVAWLAPPFPEASPELFRSVLGISATPPPPDPDDSNGGSMHRGTNVILRWNHLRPTGQRSFGPVYSAEARRATYGTGEECVVVVDLADRATIKKWENE